MARAVDNSTSRFRTVVAMIVGGVLSTIIFCLVGTYVLAYTLWFVPVLGPVLLGVGALGGVWLVVRGTPYAQGYGAGMVAGWVLLAFLSSGWSVGFFN